MFYENVNDIIIPTVIIFDNFKFLKSMKNIYRKQKNPFQ